MGDGKIIDLFFERSEEAIVPTQKMCGRKVRAQSKNCALMHLIITFRQPAAIYRGLVFIKTLKLYFPLI